MILSGMLEPEVIVVELGRAEVKQIFFTGKKDMIVGCKIIEGKIEKKVNINLIINFIQHWFHRTE
jgi:translation initiation factor IF-2